MPTELLTRDEQTATPAASPAPPTVPPPGLLVRLRDSCWIAWTFTLLFNWAAFLWIGFRARNQRWIAWGIVYAVPAVAAMVAPTESLAFDLAVLAMLVLGPVSIAHAFAVRRTYIAQRRAIAGGLEAGRATASPPEPELPRAAEETAPQEPRERGVGGLIHRGLESIVDPCHVERARELLEEGRRQEALAVLEQGLPAARKSIARDWCYSGEREQDLSVVAEPALEELAEVRALAQEVVDDARWASWDDELVAGFEELAAAAEREAEEVRTAALARSDAKRRRGERRRFKKAMALCLVMPFLSSFVAGFSAPEGGPAPDPSTVEWVIGLIVVPVAAAVSSAAATRRLWRREVTSNLLYAPFWVGFIAAALAAGIAMH